LYYDFRLFITFFSIIQYFGFYIYRLKIKERFLDREEKSVKRIAIARRERGNALSMDVYADCLIAELRRIRPHWEIVEIAPQPWSDDPQNSWHSGNPARKYYERFWRHPLAVSREKADLFHIIDHTDGHIARWLNKLGKPIVVTCHDLVQYVYPEILKDRSRYPALSMASWRYSVGGMKLADCIITVSNNTAKDVSSMLHANIERVRWRHPRKPRMRETAVKTIPNGVDTQFRIVSCDRIRKRKQQHTASLEEICLLNVGSTHQRKNIFTIFKVLETLIARGLSVRLWKVGDDFTAEQQAYIREHQLESQITYFGYPDRQTLIELYNAADLLLAPSLYEGFGLTILEAMACGTPVVTSNVSSLPEVVGDAAITLDPLDVEGIAKAIGKLQQDASYRQKLIDRGLKRASGFTWQNTAQQTALIYEKLFE
jgi:glycosyltransferase involved in cell wall biosynthesis